MPSLLKNILRRRLALGIATGLSLTLLGLQRLAHARGSPHSITPGTILDINWVDDLRSRSVPARLYLPAQDPSNIIPSPLVVFSHGLGGTRRGYTYLGHHFANNGVASLHLQHVGSDRGVWSGNIFSFVDRLSTALRAGEAVARVQDLSFALDRLFESDLAIYVDKGRLIAAGHSYGANTALLAAGAQVLQEGQFVNFRDKRIEAAIAISAPHFYGEQDTLRSLRSVLIPSLHITATEDTIRMPGYYSNIKDRLAVYEATGSNMKWLAVFEGGSHSMFTDRSRTGGIDLNPKVKAATAELSTAFIEAVFGSGVNDSNTKAWSERHSNILYRFKGSV